MSLEAALRYAARDMVVFPCHWGGEDWKQPLTRNGCRDATADRATIIAWWSAHPTALVGFAAGRGNPPHVVLDVDVKNGKCGFDTLEDLGYGVLPCTPMVHTPSGGLHLHFQAPEHVQIRNTQGGRGCGIGPGLDWRGAGGYVILPSLGSGYRWDGSYHLGNTPLAPVPADLLPRVPVPGITVKPSERTEGLSPYGEAALDSAVARILRAPNGEQEATLNGECFAIGRLAGAGAVPEDFARKYLKWGARHLVTYDPRRPWREAEIEAKVDRAFDQGLRHPRRVRR